MRRSIFNLPGYIKSTGIFLSGVVLIFLLSGNMSVAQDGILWAYHPRAGYIDATPAVGDIDGDGVQDLVMAATSGRILALDAKGHKKWAFDAGGIISNPVTLAGNPLRVFALTNPGKIICLDAKSGHKIWETPMPDAFLWGMTAPAAADITGDGQTDIIVADRGGHLVCLDKNGSPVWEIKYKSGFNTAPAIADLNGDGKPEILLGTTDFPLVCFSHKGKELWHTRGEKSSGSSPLVYDPDGDGKPEILLGDARGLAVYDAGGHLRWHHTMKSGVHDAIAAGDVDGDGKMDIVVVDLLGDIACLTRDGQLKWTAGAGNRVRRSPAIADMDGDGKEEVIVGGYAGALYVFDGEGNMKEQIPLHGNMNATPVIVDFYGDHRLAVVCATTSEVVTLTRMSQTYKGPARVLWGEYRVNPARTGALLPKKQQKHTAITGVDYGPLHVGINMFSVSVENPGKQSLTLSLTLRTDEEKPVHREWISSDSLFTGRIPYTVTGQHPEELHFSCRLLSGNKLIDQRRQEFYLIPFRKDLDDLRRLVAGIKDNIPKLADKRYIQGQVTLLDIQRKKLEKETALAGVMTPLERAALRTRFENLQKTAAGLNAMTGAAVVAGGPLAAYKANPRAPFGGVEEIVEGRTSDPGLSVEAFAGETESAAVNLANFSDKTVTVRVEPEDLVTADSSEIMSFRRVLEFHEVLDVPTHTLDLSADALPLMNQARTIVISPWSVRQVWLNVDASRLTPGDWRSRIRFRTLEVEPAETVATLTIKVWQTRLTEKQPLRLCQWGYVASSVLKDIPEAALKDQVKHGTNVFVATSSFVPAAHFNEQGELTGALDFTAHDTYIRQHAPHGIILFSGYQSALKGPAAFLSPVWIKAYKQWIGLWSKHLLDMGLTYDDFAFYPVDEPGLHKGQVDEVVSLARPVKEVDPRLKIYTDPVARTSMADLKKMAPYIDIWCPNRNGYLRHEGGDKLAFIKSTGKTVWTYECEGDAKHQSPLGYYRAQAWLSRWRGLTGVGFWSYCTSRFDPWYVPRGGQDYLLIYPGEGVVTSKRWEAVRDGVEDYNVLMQLQQVVSHPPRGIDPVVLHKIQDFLQHDVPVVAAFCGLEKEGTLPGVEGLPGMRRTADRRWETLQQTRHKMAELLEMVQKQK